jgi:uncharacterized membrane protein YqjE
MDDTAEASTTVTGATRQFVHRLMAVGENRFQLLLVEVEQERNRLVDILMLASVTAGLGLLAGIVLSAALVVYFWPTNPALALLILGVIYVAVACIAYRRLLAIRRNMTTLAATVEQLKKDAVCFRGN